MKKIFFSVFLCLLITSAYSGKGKKPIPFADLPEELQFVLNQWEKAVAGRDTVMIMGLIDRDYKAHQWDKYLKRKTGFFLNELFCGKVTGTEQERCLPFNEITQIKQVEILKQGKSYTVKYRIKTPELEITTELEILAKKKVVYGVVGSSGFTQLGGL
jgi:hypothetical protein